MARAVRPSRFWIGAIGLLYVAYGLIYLFGLDGANDYFWVNNDFFLVEMVGISAIITGILAARAIRERQQQPEGAKSWRPFRPVLVAAGLTILFLPWAIVLVLVSVLTGLQDF